MRKTKTNRNILDSLVFDFRKVLVLVIREFFNLVEYYKIRNSLYTHLIVTLSIKRGHNIDVAPDKSEVRVLLISLSLLIV